MRPWLAWILLAGCTSAPPAVSPLVASPSAVALRPRTLVSVVETPARAPGLDVPAAVTIHLEAPHSAARQIEGLFLGGVSFEDAAVLLDLDHHLVRHTMDGPAEPIADDVAFVPVVTLDGAHLAYATFGGALHVLDLLGDRVVASGLSSIGAISFSPDGAQMAFVGARPGGVAGVWLASSRADLAARCLTNCDRGVGDVEGMVPLPAQPIEVGAVVRWVDETGAVHEVRP